MPAKKDNRYFIDRYKYNCPYCQRGAVRYTFVNFFDFAWGNNETRRCVLIKCNEPSCQKISLHMTRYVVGRDDFLNRLACPAKIVTTKEVSNETGKEEVVEKKLDWPDDEIDDLFFYHHPNSTFVVDDRIPPKIRGILDEANTCHKMGLQVGASACLRKTIFEILSLFKISKIKATEGNVEKIPYLDRLDMLKNELKIKIPTVETDLIDDIKKVYALVCRPLHERLPDEEWEDFTNVQYGFLIDIVHNLLMQIFVDPDDRAARRKKLSEFAKKIPGLTSKKA